MNEELKQQKKEEENEKFIKFPLQYNQMTVNGLMELNDIDLEKFETKLKELDISDYKLFLKYRTIDGIGAFILQRLTDTEFTL